MKRTSIHSLTVAIAAVLFLWVGAPGQCSAQEYYGHYVRAASAYHNLPPSLLQAVIKVESGGKESARSPKGAIGRMQLMPGTARDLGVNPHDPWHNIFGGARYLREMIDLYHGNLPLALAAYNAGPGRVKDRVPNIPETQHYVRTVMAYYSRYYYGQ
jgi:soluble lytic murein transglycosylase-like protein